MGSHRGLPSPPVGVPLGGDASETFENQVRDLRGGRNQTGFKGHAIAHQISSDLDTAGRHRPALGACHPIDRRSDVLAAAGPRCRGCGDRLPPVEGMRRGRPRTHCTARCRMRTCRSRSRGGALLARFEFWSARATAPEASPAMRRAALAVLAVFRQGGML